MPKQTITRRILLATQVTESLAAPLQSSLRSENGYLLDDGVIGRCFFRFAVWRRVELPQKSRGSVADLRTQSNLTLPTSAFMRSNRDRLATYLRVARNPGSTDE